MIKSLFPRHIGDENLKQQLLCMSVAMPLHLNSIEAKRQAECEALNLIVAGDPGMGKSTLGGRVLELAQDVTISVQEGDLLLVEYEKPRASRYQIPLLAELKYDPRTPSPAGFLSLTLTTSKEFSSAIESAADISSEATASPSAILS